MKEVFSSKNYFLGSYLIMISSIQPLQGSFCHRKHNFVHQLMPSLAISSFSSYQFFSFWHSQLISITQGSPGNIDGVILCMHAQMHDEQRLCF